MKTVALIPVKLESKRLENKNIKPFYDGTPLIHFMQKTCKQSELIDEVYIYCSEESIINYILPGVNFLLRPKVLDTDAANANDIIRMFMKEVDADIYVNAHTTSPFAKTETIDDCIRQVASGEYDSAFCAEAIKTFIWENGLPINFNPDNFPRTQDLPTIYMETSIAYVFTKETFVKYGRRLGIHPYIKEVGKIEAMDIDYPEDFEISNAIYKEIINR